MDIKDIFNNIENKIDNISKELVIKEIESFPDKRDSRFSSIVSERYNEDKHTVKEYLKGNLKELGSAEGIGSENYSEFKVVVLDNFRVLYIKKNNDSRPVPVGNWMDWWERDHRVFFGITKGQYKNLSLRERANLEAMLQLHLWINIEYYNEYASFYLPEEYDKWYWDEGGKEMVIGSIENRNNYWKKKLKET